MERENGEREICSHWMTTIAYFTASTMLLLFKLIFYKWQRHHGTYINFNNNNEYLRKFFTISDVNS